MARSRNIKPGFFSNDVLAEVPALGRLLFAGLWTIADRAGRLEDRPKRIKAEVLPYDDCDADALLQQLADRGFLIRYEVSGTRYIQVVNWDKHQNPHVKEAPSTIPDQDGNLESTGQEQDKAPDKNSASTGQAPDKEQPLPERAGLIPDSLIPRKREARASRLPDSFPGPDEVAWAKAERPGLDVQAVVVQFRDYWVAQPGKDGRKADWPATWRNWVRKERDTKQARASPGGRPDFPPWAMAGYGDKASWVAAGSPAPEARQ